MLKALVLDGHSRAAVETIQSLARHHIRVDVAGEESCLAFKSRLVSRQLLQPPVEQPDLFLEWLRGQDGREDYSLIVPPTEISLRPFASLPDTDMLKKKAALPPHGALQIALNKHLTVALATQLGLPVPASKLIDSIEKTSSGLSFPMVLKPIASKVLEGGRLRGITPKFVQNENEHRWQLQEMLQRTPVLQQEYIPGTGLGVELLYQRGEPVWHFCHARLHEGSFNSRLGSGSSYRCSVVAPPEILRGAKSLLCALRWHGVAMVEFKIAKDGRFWLMEINPRLWGSLALAIDAGVDFPYGLFCLATERPLPPQPEYRVRYFTRAVREDIVWVFDRIRSRPDMSASMEVLRFFRPLLGIESWDLFDWRDIGVTFKMIQEVFAQVIRALVNRMWMLRLRRLAKRLHKETLDNLRGSVRPPERILFLCYGNICRSPLAELLAKKELPGLEVISAGFHQNEGRSTPQNLQSLARSLGVDLSVCSSKRVTPEMVENADLIILMDIGNLRDFRREFPNRVHKVLFLGLFLEQPELEIPDPFGAGFEETSRTIKLIEEGISTLAAQIRKTSLTEASLAASVD